MRVGLWTVYAANRRNTAATNEGVSANGPRATASVWVHEFKSRGTRDAYHEHMKREVRISLPDHGTRAFAPSVYSRGGRAL